VLWIVVDVAVGALALLVLAVLGFGLYRRVRGLVTTLDTASARIGEASAGIAASPPPRSSRHG
jgi:hypothetical protein